MIITETWHLGASTPRPLESNEYEVKEVLEGSLLMNSAIGLNQDPALGRNDSTKRPKWWCKSDRSLGRPNSLCHTVCIPYLRGCPACSWGCPACPQGWPGRRCKATLQVAEQTQAKARRSIAEPNPLEPNPLYLRGNNRERERECSRLDAAIAKTKDIILSYLHRHNPFKTMYICMWAY